MSKTNSGGRTVQPIGKAEALQILESAVSYCRQAGLDVRAGNVGDKFALTIGGVELKREGESARLALRVPQAEPLPA
jgi:hypothetical protein